MTKPNAANSGGTLEPFLLVIQFLMLLPKTLNIQEIPIPLAIEQAGPKINRSLTITPAKYDDRTT